MEEDDAEAVLEEKEARRLQKQMAEQLEEDDFGLDVFKASFMQKCRWTLIKNYIYLFSALPSVWLQLWCSVCQQIYPLVFYKLFFKDSFPFSYVLLRSCFR